MLTFSSVESAIFKLNLGLGRKKSIYIKVKPLFV